MLYLYYQNIHSLCCYQEIAFWAPLYLPYYFTVGVFLSSVLGPTQFSIFTSDTQWDLLGAPSASFPVRSSWVVVDLVERRDAIQGHPDGFEEWAHINLRKFSKTKHEILHLGQSNPQYKTDWRIKPCIEDLGTAVDEKMDVSWKCAVATQKGNCILGCIKRSALSR